MKTKCKIEIKEIENDPKASFNSIFSEALKLSKLYFNCEVNMKYQSNNMNTGYIIKFKNGEVVK